MTERKLDEIEKLEGIGDIGEVPEDGFKIEEAEENCFCGFEAEEDVETIEVDDIEEVDEEYLEEPKNSVEEEEK